MNFLHQHLLDAFDDGDVAPYDEEVVNVQRDDDWGAFVLVDVHAAVRFEWNETDFDQLGVDCLPPVARALSKPVNTLLEIHDVPDAVLGESHESWCHFD